MRVDAPVLERELFRLFETQPEWTFQQLQLETKQPTMHLKTVLEQVSMYAFAEMLVDLQTEQQGNRSVFSS